MSKSKFANKTPGNFFTCKQLLWLARAILCASIFLPFTSLAAETLNWQRLGKLKAAYIYNVIKFTQWPDTALAVDQSIRICLFGEDQTVSFLQQELQGRQAQSRPIDISHFAQLNKPQTHTELAQQIDGCQLIYLAEKGRVPYQDYIRASAQLPILLTSGFSGFAEMGGMVAIQHSQETGKVKFEINISAVSQSGLNISSKLLKFARIVRFSEDKL